MAVSPPVTALPWYDRRDYPVLLKLFSDLHMLPADYDAWLNRTEQTESQLQKAGFAVFCRLVQGAERLPRPVGAPDLRK